IPSLRCPKATGDFSTSTADYSSISDVPATGNYVAFAGTHIDAASSTLNENAAMNSPATNGGKGLKIEDLTDGTSKTFLLCESREIDYGSWYDGQCAWVVGMRAPLNNSDIQTRPDDGYLGPIDGKPHAINFGPKDAA